MLWSGLVQNANGTTNLSQSRKINKVNEIIDISETTGPSWITLAYDRNGNMTTLPSSAAPTISLTATYDAWNHLISVADGSTVLATYSYDGQYRRIKSTSSSVTRHSYHTSSWQTIEERIGASTLDSSGAVQERIQYAPCGSIQFLDAGFGVRSNSSFDIRTTYTGGEWIPELAKQGL